MYPCVNEIPPLNRPKKARFYTCSYHRPVLGAPSHLKFDAAEVTNHLSLAYFVCYGGATTTSSYSRSSSVALFFKANNLFSVALIANVLLHLTNFQDGSKYVWVPVSTFIIRTHISLLNF